MSGLPRAPERTLGSTLDAPGHRATAPGGLALVQALLNSVDIEAGVDELERPRDLGQWLRSRDLLDDDGRDPTEIEHVRVLEFREALRDVLSARDAGERDVAAAATLEQAAGRAPVVISVSADGTPELVPAAAGVGAAVARIMGEIARAAAEGTWARLKICRNDACRWSFYDVSRNRSGTWCTMAVCGNRMKGRAFRARRGGRAAGGVPAGSYDVGASTTNRK